MWLGWLTMFGGAVLSVAGTLLPQHRAMLHRAGWLVGLAGIVTTAVAAFGLMFQEPWSVSLGWSLPIGGIVLKVKTAEALMIFLVQLVGGLLVFARPWGDEPCDTAAFLILLPALGLCLTARDVVLFLMAWEVMALCGVVWQRGRGVPEDQYEGYGLWAYLVSAHLATACLLVLLPMIALSEGQQLIWGQPLLWDIVASKPMESRSVWAFFVLLVAGFGTKAGLAPFHPWIRTVYRNAPAWFGAASSGLMAKVSLFLMFRTLVQLLPLFGAERMIWVAAVLMLMGLFSGLIGLAGALTNQRIKVVLGYSSVENVGIIMLGFGLGLWGVSRGAWPVAILGFCGAWFHLLNHMLAKTLLFLSTAVVANRIGTDDLARLGGLLRRMPTAGRAFGLGAMALSAMIPLNAFSSELLIYNGLFLGVISLGAVGRDLAILSVTLLGMIGGLAAVCFTAVWGLGFLGNPRSVAAEESNETGMDGRTRLSLNILSMILCMVGIVPLIGFLLIWGPVTDLLANLGCPADAYQTAFEASSTLLGFMSLVSGLLLLTVFGLKRWRDKRLCQTGVANQLTWDCGFGYVDAFPKGQYSGLSFFGPMMPLVSKLTFIRIHHPDLSAAFPAQTRLRVESSDGLFIWIYEPIYRKIGQKMARLRWIQAGSIQLYLAMLALTLMAMLVWLMIF